MAKRQIFCPDCGHKFKINLGPPRVQTLGVRAKRTGATSFNYELTAPAQLPDDDGPPILSSPLTDLTLIAAFGGALGCMCGYIVWLITPASYYPPYAVVIGGMGGVALGWGWLLAEHNQRLKRVLPWFLEQRQNWQSAAQANDAPGVTLTVDHRYRDTHSEPGRSIQYFGTLPVDVERFNEYARCAVRGDSLAISQWTGSGRLFSRNEYDGLSASSTCPARATG